MSLQIGPYQIVYNTQLPGWIAQGRSRTPTWKPGPLGQQQAIRWAIRQHWPQLAKAVDALIAANPSATSRAWQGALLLVSGCVQAADRPDAVAIVRSLYEPGRQVSLFDRGRTLVCPCEDYRRGGTAVDGRIACAHILAYQFARQLRRLCA